MKKDKKGSYYDNKLIATQAIDEEINRVIKGEREEYKVSALILFITGSYPVSQKLVKERVELTADVGLITVKDGIIKKKFAQ